MGQQTNKIIKRRRRAAYNDRLKAKALDFSAAAKAKPRRAAAAPKKVAAAETAV